MLFSFLFHSFVIVVWTMKLSNSSHILFLCSFFQFTILIRNHSSESGESGYSNCSIYSNILSLIYSQFLLSISTYCWKWKKLHIKSNQIVSYLSSFLFIHINSTPFLKKQLRFSSHLIQHDNSEFQARHYTSINYTQ